jgi:hypothetical protein
MAAGRYGIFRFWRKLIPIAHVPLLDHPTIHDFH